MKLFIFTMLFLISTGAWTQENTSTNKNITSAKKLKPKKSVALDFNSWFEPLQLKNSGITSEIKSIYYGLGVSYDYAYYESTWGYGFLAGLAQGYGLAGQANQSGTYYEKRVPWTALRAGARVFTRLNPRFDLGIGFLAQYRQISWKAENGYTPVAPTNPLAGFLVETRWRLNYKFELLQSFGQYTKDSSLVWRIGTNYTLN